MRLANENDINELCKLRILEQKEDWKNEYEDNFNLYNVTMTYLKKHLNKDFYMFIEEKNNKIIATCGLQIIEYLPQCNDNGKQGYICNVFTINEFRKQGIQTNLIKAALTFAKKQDLCELDLSTDSDVAISIYKKLGFKHDSWAMKNELVME